MHASHTHRQNPGVLEKSYFHTHSLQLAAMKQRLNRNATILFLLIVPWRQWEHTQTDRDSRIKECKQLGMSETLIPRHLARKAVTEITDSVGKKGESCLCFPGVCYPLSS